MIHTYPPFWGVFRGGLFDPFGVKINIYSIPVRPYVLTFFCLILFFILLFIYLLILLYCTEAYIFPLDQRGFDM